MDALADKNASAVRYELRWNEFLEAALKLRAECSMIVNLLMVGVLLSVGRKSVEGAEKEHRKSPLEIERVQKRVIASQMRSL